MCLSEMSSLHLSNRTKPLKSEKPLTPPPLNNMVVCSCGTQPYYLILTLAFPNKHFSIIFLNFQYFVCTETYGVQFEYSKTFCRKKNRVRCKKDRVPAEPLYSRLNPIFSGQTVLLGFEPCTLDTNYAIREREVFNHHTSRVL